MSEYTGIDINQSSQTQSTTNYWSLPSTKEETKESNTSLSFEDMLLLMVTQLQNQTIDNQADTNDMMNQLIQMTVMQAMTEMTSQVEELTTANIMSYSASLVGKEVTVGVLDSKGNLTDEVVGTVTATGTYNGQQVIFMGDRYYPLSSIMSVGRLPESAVDGTNPGGSTTEDGDEAGGGDKAEGAGDSGGAAANPGETTNPGGTTGSNGTTGSGSSSQGAQQAASDSGISAQSVSVEARSAAAAAQNQPMAAQGGAAASYSSPSTRPAAAVEGGEAAAQAQEEEDAGVPNWLFENGSPRQQQEEGTPNWLFANQGEQAAANGVPSWLVGPDA